MDITPLVGILGAIVGGGIGLLGQGMNLREQRRKETRERVVDFLIAADELKQLGYNRAHATDPSSESVESVDDYAVKMARFQQTLQYVDLVAPVSLCRQADALAGAVLAVCRIGYTEVGSEKDDLSLFAAAMDTYHQQRRRVVTYLRPYLQQMKSPKPGYAQLADFYRYNFKRKKS